MLPLVTRSPLNATRVNFDTDRNSADGLTIARGGDLELGSPDKLQRFRLTPGTAVRVQGTATAELWGTPEGGLFSTTSVRVALVECATPTSCTVLDDDTDDLIGFFGTVQRIDVAFAGLDEVIEAGHSLELWVVVDNSSDRDLVLLYDTVGLESTVTF